MKVVILSGFLGSGKTTLLSQLLAFLGGQVSTEHVNVAVIENEIGKFNIDGAALETQGIEVHQILSGCACCSLAGDLISGVNSIKDQLDPQWLIIEVSGMGIGSDVAKTLHQRITFITEILTLVLVDARRFEIFAKALKPLMTGQLVGIDLILLNKIDLISPDELAKTKELVRNFNPNTEIVEVSAIEPLDGKLLSRLTVSI